MVVEGRSAFMLLDRNDVVKVFLNASFDDRVKHVAERRGISIEIAREDVKRSDKERNDLIQRFYRKNCLEATNFDISVRTSPETFFRAATTIGKVMESIS